MILLLPLRKKGRLIMSNNENTVNLADELLEDTALDAVAEDKAAAKQENKKKPGKKKETVVIHLPLTKELKEPAWVSVNGKTYQIKRGVDVEVPVGVAKVIRRSEKAVLAALSYDEEMEAPENL